MTIEFEFRIKEELEKEGINHWAKIYIEKENDDTMDALKPKIKERGHLTLDDLTKVEAWTKGYKRVENNNDEELVKEITANVLDSKNERIELLVVKDLYGVGWSIASAILHWFAKGEYPILSLPAIQSCSIHYGDIDDIYKIKNKKEFWWEYTKFCRKIAAKNNITMRTLDRALCQYSSENPPKVKENPDN